MRPTAPAPAPAVRQALAGRVHEPHGRALRRTSASLSPPWCAGAWLRSRSESSATRQQQQQQQQQPAGGSAPREAHLRGTLRRRVAARLCAGARTAVSEGRRSGSLLALTPFAAPLAHRGHDPGLTRLRNTYRLVPGAKGRPSAGQDRHARASPRASPPPTTAPTGPPGVQPHHHPRQPGAATTRPPPPPPPPP